MKKKQYIIISIITVVVICGYLGYKTIYIARQTGPGSAEHYEDSPDNYCHDDSDCKFECGCGCINIKSDCKKKSLCNMPPGSCKCIDNICSFVEDDWRSEDFNTLVLSCHNWEGHESTINIIGTGLYSIESGNPAWNDLETRKGKITKNDLDNLGKIIFNSNIFDLNKEYNSKQVTRTGNKCILTIKTESKFKLINFYSEDETVPKILLDIVDEIYRLTN